MNRNFTPGAVSCPGGDAGQCWRCVRHVLWGSLGADGRSQRGARSLSACQDSDFIIAWGANLDSTNVHQIPFINMARRRGAKLVVIDVWRTRAARRADWFIPIRVGTDAALALGMAHVLQRDNLHRSRLHPAPGTGIRALGQEVLPRYTPATVEADYRRASKRR